LKGIPKSEEAKKNMSIAAKKRKPNNIKLTKEQVENIILLTGVKTQTQIGKEFNISQVHVGRIQKGIHDTYNLFNV